MNVTADFVLAISVLVNLGILGWISNMLWTINSRLIRVEVRVASITGDPANEGRENERSRKAGS